MEIDLEAIVETPDASVDMKAGLETFQGMSDAARKIAISFANDKVLQRINYKSDIRTRMKHSFKGSYGLRFSIDILGRAEQNAINDMGKETLVELISYTMTAARYGRVPKLSKQASLVVESMRMSELDLIEEIRSSCMRKIHKVPAKFNHDVVLNYKERGAAPVQLAKFDKRSAQLLTPIHDAKELRVSAAISRLNINTGNGRLTPIGERDTFAFGFSGDYAYIDVNLKKLFSENLDDNNGVPSNQRTFIDFVAQTIRLKDGKIVKYIVRRMK